MKLSITMIMKNEAHNLDRCLSSIKPISDAIDTEIVIIDTGSTDKSVEIAKKYTDKIYYFKWINDFGAARNFGIEKCSGDWIFVIDADEKIINHDKFIEIFNSPKINEYDVVDVLTYNIVNSSTGAFTHCHNYRFIKNIASNRYIENLHAYIPTNNAWYTEEVLIYHYGYDNSDKELMLEKSDRNLEYLLKEYEELGEKTSALKLSQITDAYNVVRKSELAYSFVEKTLSKALEEKNYLLWLSYIGIKLRTLVDLKRYEDIISEYEVYTNMKKKLGIVFSESDITVHCSMFTACEKTNNTEGMIKYGKLYLYYIEEHKKEPDKFTIIRYATIANSSVYLQAMIAINLVKCYYDIKDFENSRKYLEKEIYIKAVSDNLLNVKGIIDNFIRLTNIYNDMNYKLFFEILANSSSFELVLEFILSNEYTSLDDIEKNNFTQQLLTMEKRLISKNEDVLNYVNFLKLREMYKNGESYIEFLNKHLNIFMQKPYTYTDIVYYFMKENMDLSILEKTISPTHIDKIIENCFKVHSNLADVFLKYKNPSNTYYSNLYIISILDRLLIEETDILSNYIISRKYNQSCKYYLETTYNEKMLNDKMIKYLPLSAQKLYHLNKIFSYLIDNKHILALKEMQIFLKNNIYIKPFVENMTELIGRLTTDDELLQLTTIFKKNITDNIFSDNLDEAKLLLKEYTSINPNDNDLSIIESLL